MLLWPVSWTTAKINRLIDCKRSPAHWLQLIVKATQSNAYNLSWCDLLRAFVRFVFFKWPFAVCFCFGSAFSFVFFFLMAWFIRSRTVGYWTFNAIWFGLICGRQIKLLFFRNQRVIINNIICAKRTNYALKLILKGMLCI